jgi:hypothetical protein
LVAEVDPSVDTGIISPLLTISIHSHLLTEGITNMGSAFHLVNAKIKAAAIDAIGPLGNAREECYHIHAPY